MTNAGETTSRFHQFNTIAKTASLMLGAAGVLLTAGIFLASFRQLPARTEENHQRIEALYARLDTVASGLRELKRSVDQQTCIAVAEKQHTDWRACFIAVGPITVFQPVARP